VTRTPLAGLASFSALALVLAFAGHAKASPFAYVANDDDTVTVVDLDGNTLRGTFPLGGEPKDVVVSPDGAKAYFATDVGLVVLDTRALQATTVPLPIGSAESVAVEPSGARVFLAHRFSANVSVYRPANGSVSALGMPHTAVRHVAMSPLGDFLWAVTDAGDVDSLDVRSGVSQPRFSLLVPGPSGIAVDGFGTVWVGSRSNRNVKAFSVTPAGAVGPLLAISANVVPGRIGIDRASGFGSVALVTRPQDDRVDRWFGSPLVLPSGSAPLDADASADRVIVTANDGPGSSGAPLGHGSITVVSPAGVQTQLAGGDDPVAVAVGPRLWAEITASPSPVQLYYFTTGSHRATVTIRPSAWDALQIGALRFGATSSTRFTLQNDTCSGRRVPAGGSCTVDVVFSWTQPSGIFAGTTYGATLEIPSNARNAAVATVPVSARYGICCLQPRSTSLGGFGG
jgi:DNA-binding beta-propeller fold protein YncE